MSSVSLHLGNHILVVQPAQHKEGVSARSNVPANAAQASNSSMDALSFEIAWFRFLREAEEEYHRRLTRNDKHQPLSIFEVNVDIFEMYLLKVSGRALAATQHLNLNMTSSMGSHMKIFDTQFLEPPSEAEEEEQKEAEINRRRALRDYHRQKRRRITASFAASLVNTPVKARPSPPKQQPPIKQQQFDTLNERDDEDDEEGDRESMPEEEEDFARETVDRNGSQREEEGLRIVKAEPSIEVHQVDRSSTLVPSFTHTNTTSHIHVVAEAGGTHAVLEFDRQGHNSHLDQQEESRIMIGNQLIDDHLLGNDEEGNLAPHEDPYGYTDDLSVGRSGNPFKDRSNLKSGSIVVSQMSLGMSTGAEEPGNVGQDFRGTIESPNVTKEMTHTVDQIFAQETDMKVESGADFSHEPPLSRRDPQPFIAPPSPMIEIQQSHQTPCPPPEVVLRFEVAVGTTPVNLSIEHRDIIQQDEALNTADAAVGTTPPNHTVDEAMFVEHQHQQQYVLDGYGDEEDYYQGEDTLDLRQESHYYEGEDSYGNHRLEVTLTAEPDKPIMVEVKGGEKQYLISALTKHIYEILSQPHRLQMLRDEEMEEQEGREQDMEQPEQLPPPNKGHSFKVNKNISLKLRSLKKNLHKNPKNQRGQMFDTQTRDEMTANLPVGRNQKSPLTVDEFENSQEAGRSHISNLPDVSLRKTGVEISLQIDEKPTTEKLHNKVSSRSSNEKALSPLNGSVVDAGKPRQTTPMLGQRQQKGTAEAEIQYSKRTATEEAFADAKIREEGRFNSMVESEVVPNVLSAVRETGEGRRRTGLSNSRKVEASETLAELKPLPRRDSKVVESIAQELIRSRPETANFNQIQSIEFGQQELPPINVRSSQLSNRLQENSKNSMYKDDEVIMQTEKPKRSRRVTTPEGQIRGNEPGISEIINSAPADIEHFSLPPLQPTIALQHPIGLFSPDGDFITRQDSQTIGTLMNLEPADEYNAPQITYYDPYSTDQTQLNVQDGYFISQYGRFSEQDQNMLSEGMIGFADDYILAEGYPLYYPAIPEEKSGILREKHSDVSRNLDVIDSSMGGSLGAPKLRNQRTFGDTKSRFPLRAPLQNHKNQGTNHANHQPHQGTNSRGNFKGSSKLPFVKIQKKRFANNSQNNTTYSLYGGPAFRQFVYTPARSLSPLRRKNYNVQQVVPAVPTQDKNQAAQPGQTQQTQPQFEEVGYFSQSPQPRQRNSPYMSDDEFKILHDFYDIHCEPTGLQRGGVPLMRVKRINRPKQKGYNIFNFADDSNAGIPKALSSLQLLYPQYQPSQFQQEYLSKTLGTPNKWFDRFYQSTRNLNNTIHNIHKQHSRKLRSYSVSSLSSGNVGPVDAPHGPRAISRENQANQTPLFIKQDLHDNSLATVELGALPHSMHPHSVSQEELGASALQKKIASAKVGGSTYMPPLHKIYTSNVSNEERNGGTQKKNKLPPRPKVKAGAPLVSQSTKDILQDQQPRSIINTNHNHLSIYIYKNQNS